jgi:hypothetical protein
MRLALVCMSLLCLATPTHAQDKDDGPAIVERAVKAHGGKDGILRLRTATVKYTFKGTLPGLPVAGETDITVEETYQLPRQMKKVIVGKQGDMPAKITWAIDGDQWWSLGGDGKVHVQKWDKDLESQLRTYLVLEKLAMLSAKDLKMTVLGESDVGGRKVLGVRVQAENPPYDINWYFDKEKGLLRAVRGKSIHPMTKKEIMGESVFSDYKEVDGVKLFHMQVLQPDGKKVGEFRVSQVRFHKKLDDNVFAPPAK